MAGSISDGTTVLSNVSITGTLLGSGVSSSAATARSLALIGSTSTLNLNQGRLVSLRTLASSAVTASAGLTNVADNEVVIVVGGASGATLIINSGGTLYHFSSAASSIRA